MKSKEKLYKEQLNDIANCCSPYQYDIKLVNGICPDCGRLTYDGEAICGCNYSSEVCKTCHAAPCDGSC